MSEHPEYLGLLGEIRADPAADGPRLIAADWLEDHGQLGRAEFIRAQVELAKTVCRGGLFRVCRGGLFRVCRHCVLRHRIEKMQSTPGCRWWSDYGPGDRITVLEWSRGFVSAVACKIDDWLEHGAEVCRLHPIRSVTPARMTPGRFGNGPGNLASHGWYWVPSNMHWPALPSGVHQPVWDCLESPLPIRGGWKLWDTPAAALDALSAALLKAVEPAGAARR